MSATSPPSWSRSCCSPWDRCSRFYEGYQKLRHPHELESPAVALVILVVALVLEGLSLRTAVREASPMRGQQSWWSFIRTTKQPELAVVLLEDTAAEVGLGFALLGVGLSAITGDALYDALGTLAIGGLLAVVAVVLGVEMYSLLLGEAASPEEQEAVRRAIASTPGVARLMQLRTMHLGPEELLVAARFELDPSLSADDAARVIDQAQADARGGADRPHHLSRAGASRWPRAPGRDWWTGHETPFVNHCLRRPVRGRGCGWRRGWPRRRACPR